MAIPPAGTSELVAQLDSFQELHDRGEARAYHLFCHADWSQLSVRDTNGDPQACPLENYELNCWLNVGLMTLFHIRQFVYLLQEHIPSRCPKNGCSVVPKWGEEGGCMTCILRRGALEYWQEQNKPPTEGKDSLSYWVIYNLRELAKRSQNPPNISPVDLRKVQTEGDPTELWSWMIHVIAEELHNYDLFNGLNGSINASGKLFRTIFCGVTQPTWTCKGCQTEHLTHVVNNQTVALNISAEYIVYLPQAFDLSLVDVLSQRYFIQADGYFHNPARLTCPSCHQNDYASVECKRIVSPPETLILKLTVLTGDGKHPDAGNWEFPSELNLDSYKLPGLHTNGKLEYELLGVIWHEGGEMASIQGNGKNNGGKKVNHSKGRRSSQWGSNGHYTATFVAPNGHAYSYNDVEIEKYSDEVGWNPGWKKTKGGSKRKSVYQKDLTPAVLIYARRHKHFNKNQSISQPSLGINSPQYTEYLWTPLTTAPTPAQQASADVPRARRPELGVIRARRRTLGAKKSSDAPQNQSIERSPGTQRSPVPRPSQGARQSKGPQFAPKSKTPDWYKKLGPAKPRPLRAKKLDNMINSLQTRNDTWESNLQFVGNAISIAIAPRTSPWKDPQILHRDTVLSREHVDPILTLLGESLWDLGANGPQGLHDATTMSNLVQVAVDLMDLATLNGLSYDADTHSYIAAHDVQIADSQAAEGPQAVHKAQQIAAATGNSIIQLGAALLGEVPLITAAKPEERVADRFRDDVWWLGVNCFNYLVSNIERFENPDGGDGDSNTKSNKDSGKKRKRDDDGDGGSNTESNKERGKKRNRDDDGGSGQCKKILKLRNEKAIFRPGYNDVE